MGVRERREREKQDLREKIMDAARAIFAHEGYEAVSMRRIAEQIEYSPAAIYAYFPDKETLFRQICRHDFLALAEPTARMARIADPIERLRQLGLMYIDFAVRHPNHYKLMFMTQHVVDPTPEDLAHKGDPDEDSYQFLLNTAADAIATGRLIPQIRDAELLAQVLWAGVHGVSSLQITHCKDPWINWRPVEARARMMVDSILRGILRNPSELDAGSTEADR